MQVTSVVHGKERPLHIQTTRDYSVNSSQTTLDVHLSPNHANSSWRKPHSKPSSTTLLPPLGANGNGKPALQQALSDDQDAVPEKVSRLNGGLCAGLYLDGYNLSYNSAALVCAGDIKQYR